MRNLKKILALVLALVMSLSLMATASAEETTAAASDYALASKVLQGLDVVRGDEGGIREADPITRAEVAALAYRIHTADVKDSQANLYYDLKDAAFTDLAPVQSWALGYIGYAHNAQIVKGNGDGTFNPTGNITGYEVLAMALRAIGYGKNGEFEGAEWQINTAAWARREKLLEGVTPSDQVSLDKPASRGMVFQILFNTIQHDDVQFSYTTPDLYVNATGTNNTMALRLGLDKITGVVMANEWADLENGSVLADGKTRLKAKDGTNYTVDYASELTDIGESRIVYIRDDKTVLDLADAGNTVKDNEGAETTVAKLKDGLDITNAEHFVNFDYSTKDTSEWLIRYVLTAGTVNDDGVWTAARWYDVDDSWYKYLKGLSTTTGNTVATWKYNDNDTTQPLSVTVTIKPDTVITSTDRAIMKDIFSSADRWAVNPDNDWVKYYVRGEVYVGTSSLEDKSDIMSWNDFVKTYIDTDETKPVTEVGNGNWLKIIDNNQDGKAEYILLTEYELDKVVDSTTKNDTTTYYYNGLDITDYTFKGLDGYTPAVNDIVLYARIDGTVQMHKVEPVKATFKAVDYKERQATTTDGDVKEQSDIGNHTRLPQILTDVNENVEYSIYLDDYGYVRAYENKTSYALVTEVYNTNQLNQGWVLGRNLTAEVLPAGQKAIAEYSVINSSYYNSNANYNPFYTPDGWDPIYNWERESHLKPATHMLDTLYQGNEFHYGDSCYNPNGNDRTWTNVAEYVMGEDGKSINLYSAAKYNNDAQKSKTDYIQLSVQDVSTSDPLYVINDTNYENYTNAPDNYVRAVDDTIFFAVAANGRGYTIRQWTGYKSSDAVNLNADENRIHAMYAVATDTSDERDGTKRYWVADVIVIELESFYQDYESISLIYSNNYKISGDVKYVQAIDSKLGQIGIIPNNVNIWNNQFTDYGFYGLHNVEVYDANENIYKADIIPVHTRYNATHNDNILWETCENAGIHYGVVRSVWDEQGRSDYITVEELDSAHNVVARSKGIHVVNGAYSIGTTNTNTTTYNTATELTFGGHASNRLNEGDFVIWVDEINNTGVTTNNAGFVIDLSDKNLNIDHSWTNPAWLAGFTQKIVSGGIAYQIAVEQTNVDFRQWKRDTWNNLWGYVEELRNDEISDALNEVMDKNYPSFEAAANREAVEAVVNAIRAKLNEIAGIDPEDPFAGDRTEATTAIETAFNALTDEQKAAVLEEMGVESLGAIKESIQNAEDADAIAAIKAAVDTAIENATKPETTTTIATLTYMVGEDEVDAKEVELEVVDSVATLSKADVEISSFGDGATYTYALTSDDVTIEEGEDSYLLTFEGEVAETIAITVTVSTDEGGDSGEDDGWHDVTPPTQRIRAARPLSGVAADVKWIGREVTTPAGQMPSKALKFSAPSSFTIQWEYMYRMDKSTETESVWFVYATIDADEYEGLDLKTINVGFTRTEDTWEDPNPETLTVEVVDAEGKAMDNWADYITISVDGENVETLPDEVEAGVVVGAESKDETKATVTVTKGTDKWTIEVTVVAEETNAPEIKTKVVVGAGSSAKDVDEAAYELKTPTTEHRTSGGVGYWNYEILFKVTDTSAYGANPAVKAVDASSSKKDLGATVADELDANGEKTGYKKITISRVAEDVKAPIALTITLTKQATVPLTISDPVTMTVDKDKLVKGVDMEQIVTLTLKDDYTDKYQLSAANVSVSGTGDTLAFSSGKWSVKGSTDGKTVQVIFSGATGKGIDSNATAVTITAAPVLKDADTETVRVNVTSSSNYNVGPSIVEKDVDLNDVELTIVPKTSTYALPAKANVKVGLKNVAGGVEYLTNTDTVKEYTYNATTGVITFDTDKTAESEIVVDISTDASAVDLLKVSFDEKGKLSVTDKSGDALADGTFFKYAVIKSNDSLYEGIEETVKGWVGKGQFTLTAANVDDLADYGFSGSYTLGVSDSDSSFLIVLVTDSAAANATVQAAGIAKVTNVTKPDVPPTKPAESSDDAEVASDNGGGNITANRTYDELTGNITITLTAKTGYNIVGDILNQDGTVNTAAPAPTLADEGSTVFTNMFTYKVASDRKTATIVISSGVAVTGKITVTMGVNSVVGSVATIADVVVARKTGIVGEKGNTITALANGKYVMLGAMSEEKVEEINAEILKQPADLSVADFMKNIKLTQVSADSEVGSNTAIDGTASLNKPYVLVMVVATNKVTNAVIIPNTFEGDIAAPTATIFGEAVTKTIAVTATPTKWTAGGATISIAAADLAAVTADDGGLVVTGGSTGPALSSTIKAVFVENTGVDKDTAGDAPAAADFDSANLDITSAEALKAALTNKPGVIYLQLRSAGSETTNANIGYVAINVSLT